jgi:uncharacterized delta-60 repeat protein
MRRKLLSRFAQRPSRALVIVAIVSLAFSATAIAAAGDLDPTFSGDGKQRTKFGADPSVATAAVRQADGKVVAVGRADDNFLVARYNLDGSLDPSFSADGRTQTSFTGLDGATDVVRRGNKIIVVGFSTDNNGTEHLALARYNANGSLDTSFSGDGMQTTFFVGFDGAGVAIQDDGKIVGVGRSGGLFALARYNPDGSLDTSFSGDGKQTTSFDNFGSDEATAVAVQADGRIVAVGTSAGPMLHAAFALARYNPNGSLDMSFSGDGRQTTSLVGTDEAYGVALQGDGKIVAVGGGASVTTGYSDFVLARYNADGSLDTSFSGDGRQTTDFGFGDSDGANDVATQGSGRIVAVGSAGGGPTGFDFALARYNVNGSLDTSFSGDGRKRTNFGGSDHGNGVVLQGDGRIVAVGSGNGEFALARYLGG